MLRPISFFVIVNFSVWVVFCDFFLFQHLRLPFVVLPIKRYRRHLLWPTVCLTMSVCSSVCLSQMGVLSKQLNVGHTKAPHNSPGTDENDIEAVKELRRWRWHTHTHTHTHIRLTAFVRDYSGEPVPERQNQSGFYWRKRQWVAVAPAGPYASLHLAPDKKTR